MTAYVATPAIDELHTEEGGLVLLKHRLVRLGPVGSVIREAAAEPATLSDLTASLVSAFGLPDGDPLALTQAAVDALIAEALLVSTDG